MDFTIHDIKTFVCLRSAPKKHTKHKTMRTPCPRHGQALRRLHKPLPGKCPVLCGLLNVSLMAVDFANYRKTGRRFLFIADSLLSDWQCYIAKYP